MSFMVVTVVCASSPECALCMSLVSMLFMMRRICTNTAKIPPNSNVHRAAKKFEISMRAACKGPGALQGGSANKEGLHGGLEAKKATA